jgi:hypothetical protein
MRIPMKRFVLQLSVILLSAGAYALGPAELLKDDASRELLNRKCIHLGTSEVLPIRFETACAVLAQPELVDGLQAEYARSVSKNGKVDFPIIGNGPGRCYYINEKGRRTDITELYRRQTNAHSFDYIILAEGKRLFGGYDAIIHLQVIDAGPAGIVYSVSSHTYLHNGLTRFSARNLSPVRKHFRTQMRIISYVAREVGTGLCEEEEVRIGLARESGSGS